MATMTLPVPKCPENKPWLTPGTTLGKFQIVGFEPKGSKLRVVVRDVDKPNKDHFTCHTYSTTVKDFEKAIKYRVQRLKVIHTCTSPHHPPTLLPYMPH